MSLDNPYIFNRPLTLSDPTCVIPFAALNECVNSILKDSHLCGIDLFGPIRTGKSSLVNIVVQHLRKTANLSATLLDCTAYAEVNTSEFLNILRKRTNYARASDTIPHECEVDNLTRQFSDLALGCTNEGTQRAAIVLDGADALHSATLTDLLCAIRNIYLYTRDNVRSALPDTCKNLRWVIVGNNMADTYRWLSRGATPFRPFADVSVSPFSLDDG